MSSNLAFVGEIVSVEAIEGAKSIERAFVVCGKGGSWQGS